MGKLFQDILTELDNETYDLSKLLWMLSVVVFLIVSIIAILKGQTWNPGEYGLGIAAVLAGGGAGVSLKNFTRPDSKTSEKSF
jgi:hypothetical protein